MTRDGWKALISRVARSILALLAGDVLGIFLCLAFVLGPDLIKSSQTARMSQWIIELKIGLVVTLAYAAAISVIAPLTWWGLRTARRGGPIGAAVLGFVLTFLAWGGSRFNPAVPLDSLELSAIFGLAGAASGWVVWRVARALGLNRPAAPLP